MVGMSDKWLDRDGQDGYMGEWNFPAPRAHDKTVVTTIPSDNHDTP
jgi:hypothetical protein